MELDYLQALMGGSLEEPPAASYRDIWVIAETRRTQLAAVTCEMLGRARELADRLGVHVATVLIGHDVSRLAGQAIACGSDLVYSLHAPLLSGYSEQANVCPLAQLIEDKKPEIVLLGATARGRDLAPRLAARLKTGYISECVALDLDESERLLLGTRRTFDGMMLSTVICPHARPQIAAVRAGCLRPLPPDKSRQGHEESIEVTLDPADSVTAVEPASATRRHVPLHEARIIVAGGRGMGGSDGFTLLKELADLLGGEVAATRSAVDLGWAPRQNMVDVTGHMVHPDLYIAVGISGSFPHRMATRGTRCLVAINSDAQAPIMAHSDYGIVGDWRAVIPELVAAIREAQTS